MCSSRESLVLSTLYLAATFAQLFAKRTRARLIALQNELSKFPLSFSSSFVSPENRVQLVLELCLLSTFFQIFTAYIDEPKNLKDTCLLRLSEKSRRQKLVEVCFRSIFFRFIDKANEPFDRFLIAVINGH